jgi:hypothetical protein
VSAQAREGLHAGAGAVPVDDPILVACALRWLELRAGAPVMTVEPPSPEPADG